MPETTTQPKSWNRRMAESLADGEYSPEGWADAIETALESAGEMKCVHLKVMLAHCYSIMFESVESDSTVRIHGNFLDEILEATR